MAKITQFIKSQLPEHVVAEYPLFVAFLEAYYEWMSLPDNPYGLLQNLPQNLDIDTSLDQFVDHFMNELAQNFPNNTEYDRSKLIKQLGELYRSKGTEKSFKLLFKLVYGEKATVTRPADLILRASDGKWIEPMVMRIELSSGDGFNLTDSLVVGQTSGASCVVSNVQVFQIGGITVHEITLDKKTIKGTFQLEQVEFRKGGSVIALGNNLLMPVSVLITDPGTVSDLSYEAGIYDTTGLLSRGIIYETLYNTDGYFADAYNGTPVSSFTAYNPQVTPIDTNFTINYDDVIGVKVPLTGSGSEGVAEIKSIGINGGIKKIQIINPGVGYDNNTTIDLSNVGNGTATANVVMGVIFTYPGYWRGIDGKLSDVVVLQDNFYYQDYSYVIRVGESITVWRDIVKGVLHPAGLALFGDLFVFSIIHLNLDVASSSGSTIINRFLFLLIQELIVEAIGTRVRIEIPMLAFGLGNTYETIEKFKYSYPSYEAGYKNSQYRFTPANTDLANTTIGDVADIIIANFTGETVSSKYGDDKYGEFGYGASDNELSGINKIQNFKEYQQKHFPKKRQNVGLDAYIKTETI